MRFVPALAALALALPLAGAAAAADTPPPAGTKRLSEVVTAIETRAGANLAYIDEVSWDDDGYWEVEYYTTAGAKVEEKIDPVSGEPRAR